MNTRMQTDAWISRIVVVLSFILVSSAAGILILKIAGKPVPELLAALGCVAASGLIRLWTSP